MSGAEIFVCLLSSSRLCGAKIRENLKNDRQNMIVSTTVVRIVERLKVIVLKFE